MVKNVYELCILDTWKWFTSCITCSCPAIHVVFEQFISSLVMFSKFVLLHIFIIKRSVVIFDPSRIKLENMYTIITGSRVTDFVQKSDALLIIFLPHMLYMIESLLWVVYYFEKRTMTLFHKNTPCNLPLTFTCCNLICN